MASEPAPGEPQQIITGCLRPIAGPGKVCFQVPDGTALPTGPMEREPQALDRVMLERSCTPAELIRLDVQDLPGTFVTHPGENVCRHARPRGFQNLRRMGLGSGVSPLSW